MIDLNRNRLEMREWRPVAPKTAPVAAIRISPGPLSDNMSCLQRCNAITMLTEPATREAHKYER